jgi:hypothetical protein
MDIVYHVEVVENNSKVFRCDPTELTIFLQIVHMTKRTLVRRLQGPSPWTVGISRGRMMDIEPRTGGSGLR